MPSPEITVDIHFFYVPARPVPSCARHQSLPSRARYVPVARDISSVYSPPPSGNPSTPLPLAPNRSTLGSLPLILGEEGMKTIVDHVNVTYDDFMDPSPRLPLVLGPTHACLSSGAKPRSIYLVHRH